MASKIFIVTGVTSGIGKALAFGLARLNTSVVLVARDPAKGAVIREQIKSDTGNTRVDLHVGDLSSLESVRKLADSIGSKYPQVDVLINNASIYKSKRQVSKDGHELMFATNHLGPFLMTNLLLDSLKSHGRILNVTAPSTVQPDFDDLDSERKFKSLNVFGATKMMNLLFTFELARRLEGTGVTVNAVHPGLARSNLMNESPVLMRWLVWLMSAPPERVTDSIIRVATASDYEKVTGRFLHKGKEIEAPAYARSLDAQQRLWQLSAELTNLAVK